MSTFSCVESVLESKIDDEIVLMSLDNGYYFALDEIGSSIWELLQVRPSSLVELCQELVKEYDITEVQCQSETHIFLQDLVEQGLIKETILD